MTILTSPKHIRVLFLISASCGLAGCFTNSINEVQVHDGSSQLVEVRVSKHVADRVFLELAYSQNSAETNEAATVEAPQPETGYLGLEYTPQQTIEGPQTLSGEADINAATFMTGFDIVREGPVLLTGRVGLRRYQTELTLVEEDGTQHMHDGSDMGVVVGGDVAFPFNDSLALHGYATYFTAQDLIGDDDSEGVDYGVYLGVKLHEAVRLRGGWFRSEYRVEDYWEETVRALDYETEGYLIGADFLF